MLSDKLVRSHSVNLHWTQTPTLLLSTKMTCVTVGNKRGNTFDLKHNGANFSRAGKIKLIYVYVLNFIKWHAQMNNIYSMWNTWNLGAKCPFIFFRFVFQHFLLSSNIFILTQSFMTYMIHTTFIIDP